MASLGLGAIFSLVHNLLLDPLDVRVVADVLTAEGEPAIQLIVAKPFVVNVKAKMQDGRTLTTSRKLNSLIM